jgi:hypothetical protein
VLITSKRGGTLSIGTKPPSFTPQPRSKFSFLYYKRKGTRSGAFSSFLENLK